MSTDRWARLRQLFDEVCELAPAVRAERLAERTDDAALRAEVEALVAAQTAGLERASQPMARMLDTLVETELKEGDQLGPWRLLERLGSGGMGAVFKAERSDGRFEQRAAVKLLRGLPSEQAHRLLSRERQILANLEHPSIARLFDGGETPHGLPYLVMEFIEGESIDDWCRARQLGLRQRLVLMLRIADALAYAHRRLILHCDLKPSNVMVRDGGQPVLLDFGVAHLLDQPGASPAAALTPGYAAPEQLAGEVATVATDVYGMGRLLAELVLGRRLAGVESHPPLRVARLARADLPWRNRLRGDVDLIIATATAQDPVHRYADVKALATDLRRYLDHEPLVIRGRAPAYRLGKLLQRRAPVVVGAALAAVVGTIATWQVVDERDRALHAEMEATEQARAAEDITGFLVSLFESAHPGNHGGAEPSVRQVLDVGAAQLLEADDLRALPRARLARTLASVYDAVGLPDREAELLDVALALQAQGGASIEERIATLSALIRADANRLRLERAETQLTEAHRLLTNLTEPSPLLQAELANSEGLLRFSQRRLADAETKFRFALTTRQQHLGDDHLQVASVLHNLGLLALEQHEPGAAVGHFQRALDIKAGTIGERHPSYLLSLESLGRSWRDAGDAGRALALLEHAAELRLAIHGERSIGTQRAFNELGAALHDAVRLDEAEHAYQRALSIASAVAGETSFEVAVVMNNLAFCLMDMGRMDEAEALYRRSLELREALLPADDARVLRLRSNLGWLLLQAGRSEDAEPLLQSVREALRADHPQDRVERANVELRLAYLALHRDDLDRAWTWFDAARELDPTWSRRNRDLALLVQTRMALAARQPDALALAEQALRARTETLGASHPGRLPWLFAAVQAARDAGQDARAREWLDEAAWVVEQTQATASPARAQLADLRREDSGS
ncbi:MAG TPA: serine/threonine-protein kinase [Xanthomonadaceae bacterium]|nr:serine/threonine-protein kinase [Xanthomonadaceae bacterium]